MCEAHHLETFVNCHSMRLLTSFVYAIIIIFWGGGGGETWTETGLMGFVRLLYLVSQGDRWAWGGSDS